MLPRGAHHDVNAQDFNSARLLQRDKTSMAAFDAPEGPLKGSGTLAVHAADLDDAATRLAQRRQKRIMMKGLRTH